METDQRFRGYLDLLPAGDSVDARADATAGHRPDGCTFPAT